MLIAGDEVAPLPPLSSIICFLSDATSEVTDATEDTMTALVAFKAWMLASREAIRAAGKGVLINVRAARVGRGTILKLANYDLGAARYSSCVVIQLPLKQDS